MRAIFLLIFCFVSFLCEAKPSPLKAIIFNFDNVIATRDEELLIDFMENSCHISHEKAEELLHKLQEHQKKGGDEKSFWARYQSDYTVKFQDPFWRRQWSRAKSISIKEIPGMLHLVETLQKKGLLTPLFATVTEVDDWAEPIEKTGYYDYFHPLFLSHQMGLSKPDPKAYEHVLKGLALPADACLFIEDQLESVQAAKEAGMDAILFENLEQLKRELLKRADHAF